MNIELFRSYCLKKPDVSEGFPFGGDALVFKVHGKMFALTDVDFFSRISLKCDPENAVLLRERYISVLPGYHLSKKHWNTVLMDDLIPDTLIFEWIDHSYALVFAKLPAKIRQRIP